MGYNSGFLKDLVTIRNKQGSVSFGDTQEYADTCTLYANVTWKKGQKSLNEGALDNIDTILVRMRYSDQVKRDSQIVFDGVIYQIQSFHPDYRENTLQITATEMV